MGRSNRKLARTFGSGVFVRIEKEETCLGFWGFGSGFEVGKFGQVQWGRLPKETKTFRDKRGDLKFKESVPVYCAVCAESPECWKKHKERVAKIFPVVSAEFERRARADMAKGIDGNETVDAWQKEFNTFPPAMMVTITNIDDGNLVGQGKPPEYRGVATLPHPFGVLM